MGVKASSNMSLIKVYLSFLKENSENENFKEKKTWHIGGLFYFSKLYLCRLYRL